MKKTGKKSVKNAGEIAERVAAKMVAKRWLRWEISNVNRDGTALLQLYCEIGARFIKWSDLSKVVGDLSGRARLDMAHAATKSLPVNLAQMSVEEPEVVIEDNKLIVFTNVSVKWVPGTEGVIWDDVHEMMQDAGLL